MFNTIIFDEGDFVETKSKTKSKSIKTIDNTVKIERLKKKIEDLKNRGTWKQPYTYRRGRILDGYMRDIEQYEAQIQELGGQIEENKNYKLEQKIKEQLLKDIPGYFPTPMEVVEKMVELAEIEDGNIILEPSAGTGNIIDGIIKKHTNNIIYVNEYSRSNYEILKEKYSGNGYMYYFNDDFMTFEKIQHFHRIIMNPPFEKKQDIEHILKARKLLKNGGILVGICSAGVKFRSDYQDLRDLILQYGEYFDNGEQYINLDSGTFKMSGTMVNSVLFKLRK